MTDSTKDPSGQDRKKIRAAYVKPELRKYGPVAAITAAVGAKANPDGGAPPIPTMTNPS